MAFEFHLGNRHETITVIDDSCGFYPKTLDKRLNIDKDNFFVVRYNSYHTPWGILYVMRNKRFVELSKFKSVDKAHDFLMDNYYRCIGLSFLGQPLCNDPDDGQLELFGLGA